MLTSTACTWHLRLLARRRLAATAPPPPFCRLHPTAAAAAEQQAAAPSAATDTASAPQPQKRSKTQHKRQAGTAQGAVSGSAAEAAQAKQKRQPAQPRKKQEQPKQQQAQQQQERQRQQQQPQQQQRGTAQGAARREGASAAAASRQRSHKRRKAAQAKEQAAASGEKQPPEQQQPQQQQPLQQQQQQGPQAVSSPQLVSGRMRAQAEGQARPPPLAVVPRQQGVMPAAATATAPATRQPVPGSPAGQLDRAGSSSSASSSSSSGSTAAPAGRANASQQRQRVATAFLRQKLADALLAGQQALGLSETKQATDALRELSQSSDRHVKHTLDRVSRQAGRQADRQRARQQQQDLLRARLANLQQRQQQRFSQQAASAGAGQGSGAEQAEQPAPGWDIEAAEALCSVGLSAEEAAAALFAAHNYRVRQLQAAARAGAPAAQGQQQAAAAARGSPGTGGAPASQPAATAAAAAALAADGLAPMSAADVKAVCDVLLGTARLGIAQLRPVLVAAPQLLACSAEDMQKQHAMLTSVWKQPRQLVAAIADFPAMLGPGFPAALGASLRELSALGMRKNQVSAAILRCPAVTQYTRQQMAANLQSVGLDLSNAPMEVIQFLADNPRLLTREGAPELGAKLRLFASWRLPPPMCPLLLARCPRLLKESDEQLQAVVDIFLGYGLTWANLHAVLLGYAPVLRVETSVVRLTLKLLTDFEVDLGRVVRYPRVFVHDPVQCIGPRLAYLAAFKPEKQSWQLVSLLSRSDDEFASLVCRRLPDEYAVFKDEWVRQFYEQVQLPANRGGGAGQRPNTLSQRLWSREVTDELWL